MQGRWQWLPLTQASEGFGEEASATAGTVPDGWFTTMTTGRSASARFIVALKFSPTRPRCELLGEAAPSRTVSEDLRRPSGALGGAPPG